MKSEIFLPSPESGVGVSAHSFYTHPDLPHLHSFHSYISRSDTIDVGYLRRSTDNGRTWSGAEEIKVKEYYPDGSFFQGSINHGYLDAATGRLLKFGCTGIFPDDDPLTRLRYYEIHYATYDAQGKQLGAGPIIHEGDEFDAEHYLPNIHRGRSSAMFGDLGSYPITLQGGTILLPCQLTHTDANGQYVNPGAGYTFHDVTVLRGAWRGDGTIAWRTSEIIVGDPAVSTRGFIEPTIAELPDGRILMVMRASNDARVELPGYRWYSLSSDAGRTFTSPEPWTWTDGEAFHSPSSCSQLIQHRNGRTYWLGNICEQNPQGNLPRYPLWIVEVDPQTALLKKDTARIVDDRHAEDSERVTLSNFFVRADRESSDLILHMTRLFARPLTNPQDLDWTADALIYRIPCP